jgi:hypothetical protein
MTLQRENETKECRSQNIAISSCKGSQRITVALFHEQIMKLGLPNSIVVEISYK